MTRILLVGVPLITMLLWGPAMAGMQHRIGGQPQMGGQSEAPESSPGQPPMRGHGMMGQGMMGMMCPMMAMMMDPSGTGMMGGQQMEPKAVGRMLQLRGDMLKAIGEVLLKHGKAMEEAH
ncbi:MAG TPA: hypothetical protein VLK82_02170 [Candidatus Tectomicrobia bacterium]|nr:hypothetical protein [Candidatus Tectomicrobia bacterium]